MTTMTIALLQSIEHYYSRPGYNLDTNSTGFLIWNSRTCKSSAKKETMFTIITFKPNCSYLLKQTFYGNSADGGRGVNGTGGLVSGSLGHFANRPARVAARHPLSALCTQLYKTWRSAKRAGTGHKTSRRVGADWSKG